MIWGTWSFSRGAVLNLVSCRLGTVFSGNLWSFLKEVKPLLMFDGEHGMALEPMQGNWASSGVDWGYTAPIHVAAVTSHSV